MSLHGAPSAPLLHHYRHTGFINGLQNRNHTHGFPGREEQVLWEGGGVTGLKSPAFTRDSRVNIQIRYLPDIYLSASSGSRSLGQLLTGINVPGEAAAGMERWGGGL